MKYSERLNSITKYSLPITSESDKYYLNCDLNESLFPIPKSILEMKIDSDDVTKYPRNLLIKLTKQISVYNSVNENNILVYNGSDNALHAIFEAFCSEDTKVLTFAPDYTQVETFIKLKTSKQFQLIDPNPLADEYLMKGDFQDIDLVYFSNPCNPTGKVIPNKIILNWLAKFPDTLFIVDEAYFEFYGATLAHEVQNFSNLILTRTFSKAFGLAGLRLGYIITNESIKNLLDKFRNEKNITNIAIKAGLISLAEISNLQRNVEELKLSREIFYDKLNRNIPCPQSRANFVLVKCRDSKLVIDHLQKNGIKVRDRSMLVNLNNCLRITLGHKDSIELIVSILNKYGV